jgi:hypothetical protein
MTTRLALALLVALALPPSAGAQPAASAPAPPAAPVAAQAPAPAQPAQAPAAPSRSRADRAAERTRAAEDRMEAMKQRRLQSEQERQSKGVNVRIEATVIESKGEQVTGRKALSVTTIDGGDWSSVRSTQSVPFKAKGQSSYTYRGAPLNMDARAFLRDDGRIRIELTLEYGGGATETASEGEDLPSALDQGIKQSVSAVLESGKPLMVAQSADATGDRRVALEVKATVLK